MNYSTEEQTIILCHELLHVIASIDLADRQTIDALLKRVSNAGMPPTLTSMVRDMIENIAEGGLDP